MNTFGVTICSKCLSSAFRYSLDLFLELARPLLIVPFANSSISSHCVFAFRYFLTLAEGYTELQASLLIDSRLCDSKLKS